MVIRGGENVYPREIEEFLYRHPKVQDVQVVGVPDRATARSCAPGSSPSPARALTEDDIRAFCKGRSRTTRCRAT
jgi:fatty-acyl-CoA synthase